MARRPSDTGLMSLPLHDVDQIWCAIVALACELTAQLLTRTTPRYSAVRRDAPSRNDSPPP